MLPSMRLAHHIPSCCIATVRCFAMSSIDLAGYKRFDRFKDSIKQSGTDTRSEGLSDWQPLQSGNLFGQTFPTLETHSQMFNGMRYTDIPIVHVKSTSNNTIISVTNGSHVLALQSAGTVGFRNARKGTNIAAQAAAIALASDALRKDVNSVRVCLKGIGPGRLPALKALQMSGLNIISITDTTPLPFNGCRPKKARRL